MNAARRTFPVVAALAMMAGCGEADGSTEPDGAGGSGMSDLQGRTFVSDSIADAAERPLRAGTTVTLTFTADSVSGSAECNSLTGLASLTDGRLVVDGVGGTEMGCPGRQFHDQWLSDLLSSRPGVMLDGDQLTLTSGDTVVELRDQRSGDPDAPLVETRWVLHSIADGTGPDASAGSVPAGITSTLRFQQDGELLASPGCNSGSAPYEIRDDALVLGPLEMTLMACDGPAMEVESAVVPRLEGTVGYEVDGAVLRIMSRRGELVYRAG